jgi:hypothetical protein
MELKPISFDGRKPILLIDDFLRLKRILNGKFAPRHKKKRSLYNRSLLLSQFLRVEQSLIFPSFSKRFHRKLLCQPNFLFFENKTICSFE